MQKGWIQSSRSSWGTDLIHEGEAMALLPKGPTSSYHGLGIKFQYTFWRHNYLNNSMYTELSTSYSQASLEYYHLSITSEMDSK